MTRCGHRVVVTRTTSLWRASWWHGGCQIFIPSSPRAWRRQADGSGGSPKRRDTDGGRKTGPVEVLQRRRQLLVAGGGLWRVLQHRSMKKRVRHHRIEERGWPWRELTEGGGCGGGNSNSSTDGSSLVADGGPRPVGSDRWCVRPMRNRGVRGCWLVGATTVAAGTVKGFKHIQINSNPSKLWSIQTRPSQAPNIWNKIWFWRILWEEQLSL
jgi:hypothetical protein